MRPLTCSAMPLPSAGEPMALPDLDIARVERWCAARVPDHARHQVHVECKIAPRHLTIVERRTPWHADLGPELTSYPIARLRYNTADQTWTLYRRDRNLRFHIYDQLAPSNQVENLLNELDHDPNPHLLGLTPTSQPAEHPSRAPPTPSQWSQAGLTSPPDSASEPRSIGINCQWR